MPQSECFGSGYRGCSIDGFPVDDDRDRSRCGAEGDCGRCDEDRINATGKQHDRICGVAVEHHSYSIEGFGGYCLRRDVRVCGGAEAGTIDVECVIVCDELHWLCGLECSR